MARSRYALLTLIAVALLLFATPLGAEAAKKKKSKKSKKSKKDNNEPVVCKVRNYGCCCRPRRNYV